MRVRTGLFTLLSVILCSIFVSTVQAQVVQPGPIFTVNVLADTDDGQCTTADCSLREAYNAANAFGAPSTVNIPAGTYPLASDLPGLVRTDISIIGAGIDDTIIDANNNSLFQTTAVDNINSFVIRNLSIRNPDTVFSVAASFTLDLLNVGIEGNVTQIYVDTSPTLNSLNIDGIQVDNITATALPVFVLNRAQFTIENSAFTNSQIDRLFDIVGIPTDFSYIENTTISGNTFGTSGTDPLAIIIGGATETILEFTHVTIADNANFGLQTRGSAYVGMRLRSSIFADNNFLGTPSDCELTVGGTSIAPIEVITTIIENNNCPIFSGTPITSDPQLLPLADNTGDTLTHSFDPASPAYDAVACVFNRDQRNVARPQGALCDIGAFELNSTPPPTAPPPSTASPPTATPTLQFDPSLSKIGFIQQGQSGLVGDQIEWVVTLQNVSSVTGFNVVVRDTLIPELRIDSINAPGGSVSINGNSFSITYLGLTPGQVVQISILTTIISPIDGQILNTACVNADNQGAEECATGSVIATLPNTGETPFWRNWLLAIMVCVVFGIFACLTGNNRGLFSQNR